MRAVAILPVYVGNVYYNVGDELDYNGEPCGSIRFLQAEPAPAQAEPDKPAEPAPTPAPSPRRRARE